MKSDLYLTPLTKINSKQINNLKRKQTSIKLVEENVGKKFLDIGLGNDSQDMTSKAQATKAKINKWDYIKLKRSCTAKERTSKMKRQPMEWGKMLAYHISDKCITYHYRHILSRYFGFSSRPLQ